MRCPDGLDATPETAGDLRLAYAEWQADRGLRARWVRWVLDDLLGLAGAVAEATEADPAHRVAEHGVTLRPDLVVRDHGSDRGAPPVLLVHVAPAGAALDRPLPG